MHKTHWPLCLILLSAAGAAAAPVADPLRSPACRQALDALQAEESAASASGVGTQRVRVDAASTARILARRQFAAGTCLGAWLDAPPQASRAAQPPIHVAPVSRPSVRPPPVVAGTPAAVSPAIAAPKPFIVSCDAGGCTASDGARLPRVGGQLLGPGGLCTAKTPGQTCP
jgi:hypothetical protein